jgi:hypothetical protein
MSPNWLDGLESVINGFKPRLAAIIYIRSFLFYINLCKKTAQLHCSAHPQTETRLMRYFTAHLSRRSEARSISDHESHPGHHPSSKQRGTTQTTDCCETETTCADDALCSRPPVLEDEPTQPQAAEAPNDRRPTGRRADLHLHTLHIPAPQSPRRLARAREGGRRAIAEAKPAHEAPCPRKLAMPTSCLWSSRAAMVRSTTRGCSQSSSRAAPKSEI